MSTKFYRLISINNIDTLLLVRYKFKSYTIVASLFVKIFSLFLTLLYLLCNEIINNNFNLERIIFI